MTLMELIVVLVILGVTGGITGLAARHWNERGVVEMHSGQIAAARRHALRTGGAISISVVLSGQMQSATALPDGSVVADSVLRVERFSGRATHDE